MVTRKLYKNNMVWRSIMKKYSQIAELTKSYLEGTLQNLTIEYVEADVFKVHILYEDDYDFFFDYDLEVNVKEKAYSFLGHRSSSPIIKAKLLREPLFEKAVFQTIYGS